MKILLIGDIFGKIGRKIIKNHLSKIKENNKIDLVIANVENATHGKGISYKHYQELKEYEIDIMTSGNHIFNIEETRNFIKTSKDLLRPLNSNPYHQGSGSIITICKNKKIRVTNLLGNTFMPCFSQNPYLVIENLLKKKDWDIHLIDFHAESTAEKEALALYFDGKIDAILGTHTHVQTADERILPNNTAFITDLGMTGPHGGVIGAEPSSVIERIKNGFPSKIIPYKSNLGQLNAVILDFNDLDNKVTSIRRINEIFQI